MQKLKEEIKQTIAKAALTVFSRKSFLKASMADIGREAGISVGNIYSYFANKEDLFYSILTPGIVNRFRELILSRVDIMKGIQLDALRQSGAMNYLDDEISRFIVKYRQQIIILLKNSQGTMYHSFFADILMALEPTILAYAYSIRGSSAGVLSKEKTVAFRIIFQHLALSLVDILEHHAKAQDIKALYTILINHHLFGVAAFLDDELV